MKKLILCLAFLLNLNLINAQKPIGPKICGSKISTDNYTALNTKIDNYLWTENVTTSLINNKLVKIPIIFHIIYDTITQSNAVTKTLLDKQVSVLNSAYRLKNIKEVNTKAPKEFAALAGDMKIEFYIDSIIRKKTTEKEFFEYDDGVKFDSTGGSNVIKPLTKLNIWICNLEEGLLGYARFPGDGDNVDGVALGYVNYGILAKGDTTTWWKSYSEGEVAVHEIGHWLGLYHIWGDDCFFNIASSGSCMGSDQVDDTPNQRCATRGCPNGKVIIQGCGCAAMYMNYMDYTNNQCMYMFTKGQVRRARAALKTMRSGFIK